METINYYKSTFENIYEQQMWNNGNPNVPLSGPGSSLKNTKEYSNILSNFIYDNECKSVFSRPENLNEELEELFKKRLTLYICE